MESYNAVFPLTTRSRQRFILTSCSSIPKIVCELPRKLDSRFDYPQPKLILRPITDHNIHIRFVNASHNGQGLSCRSRIIHRSRTGFSATGLTGTDRHNRLHHDNLEAIQLLRSAYLSGFAPQDKMIRERMRLFDIHTQIEHRFEHLNAIRLVQFKVHRGGWTEPTKTPSTLDWTEYTHL